MARCVINLLPPHSPPFPSLWRSPLPSTMILHACIMSRPSSQFAAARSSSRLSVTSTLTLFQFVPNVPVLTHGSLCASCGMVCAALPCHLAACTTTPFSAIPRTKYCYEHLFDEPMYCSIQTAEVDK
ncbi:hypothetical protein BS17DRAFT_788246 [Gyrodon lividus]|nr:hypothetical protein BS17DRAFT_788246 [Gyrodon lividus]